MLRGDERAHLGLFALRIADLHVACCVDEQLDETVVCRLLDQDARARATVLAGVVEHGVGCRGRCFLEVRVGEDDVRRLAAELERHAFDRSGRALHHAASDFGRAGEPDLRDVGMLDEALSDHAARPDDHVDHAFGNPRLEN